MESKTFLKKLNKKLKRHQHTVSKETGVVCSDTPTKHLALCNTGQINGLTEEIIIESFKKFGQIERVLLIPGKSSSFLTFSNQSSACEAFEHSNGQLKIAQDGKPVFLSYVETLPDIPDEKIWNELPPGLEIIENFVTKAEESDLLALHEFSGEENNMRHRQVKHYGFEFRYDINNVDKDKPLPDGIPNQCNFLFERLPQRFKHFKPDQLTINQYKPGQGIPAHVDTHSAFEDPILSLSLGSDTVMEFRKQQKTIAVFLPRRSLAIISGECRYDWTHGITPKTFDFHYNKSGCVSFKRGTRISFTFRKILQGECCCQYTMNCDSYNKQKQTKIDKEIASQLEDQHVHNVYEDIAGHFSETRHKPWPNVLDFVMRLKTGSLLVDVGCGNGKYFGHNANIFQIGTDRSFKLNSLCQERGCETFTGNCLNLPLRDNIADGIISIAVIHHLSTSHRRKQAISEILRVLKPKGQALIYVWAKEQVKNNEKSTYIKQDRKNRKSKTEPNAPTEQEVHIADGVSLPVHTNRTDFNHSDLLVPWKLKNNDNPQTFLRFYHVFEDGELDGLCKQFDNVLIKKSFYDQEPVLSCARSAPRTTQYGVLLLSINLKPVLN